MSRAFLSPSTTSTQNLEFCTLEKEGHLLVVTINRPKSLNALHAAAHIEFNDVFDDFERDPDLWVAIVTGEGRAFSAGNDLVATAKGTKAPRGTKPPAGGFGGLTTRYDMQKPIIAAVNGIAMGGGFEIALSCDLIVASEKAVFALPEPKVGLFAAAGGVLRLPRLIGMKRAMGMMLTGRRVSAAEGYELGFVNEVVPGGNEECLLAAKKWAHQILECSPMSIRATKQAAMRGTYHDGGDLAKAYADQRKLPATIALFKSADSKEGPRAFAQKRKPNWTGK
jgi:acetyl-CoA C-acetyltransferase